MSVFVSANSFDKAEELVVSPQFVSGLMTRIEWARSAGRPSVVRSTTGPSSGMATGCEGELAGAVSCYGDASTAGEGSTRSTGFPVTPGAAEAAGGLGRLCGPGGACSRSWWL